MKRVLTGAVLGAAAFTATHIIIVQRWPGWFGGTPDHAPYWMNSANRAPIVFTAAAVFAAAAIATFMSAPAERAAAISRQLPEQRLLNAMTAAASTTGGAVLAMISILFTQPDGPGNLFPIAIALGGAVLALASLLGAAAATAIVIIRRRAA